jgi:hypothetical protein
VEKGGMRTSQRQPAGWKRTPVAAPLCSAQYSFSLHRTITRYH